MACARGSHLLRRRLKSFSGGCGVDPAAAGWKGGAWRMQPPRTVRRWGNTDSRATDRSHRKRQTTQRDAAG